MATLLNKRELDLQPLKDIEKHLKEVTGEDYKKEVEFYLMVRFKDDYIHDIETEKSRSKYMSGINTHMVYYSNLSGLAAGIMNFKYVTGIHFQVPAEFGHLFKPDVQYHRMIIDYPPFKALHAERNPKGIEQFTIFIDSSAKLCTYNAATKKLINLKTSCTVEEIRHLANFCDRLNDEVPEEVIKEILKAESRHKIKAKAEEKPIV